MVKCHLCIVLYEYSYLNPFIVDLSPHFWSAGDERLGSKVQVQVHLQSIEETRHPRLFACAKPRDHRKHHLTIPTLLETGLVSGIELALFFD